MNSASLPLRGLLAAVLFSCAAAAETPATSLPRATPESQGIASAGLQALVDEIDAKQLGLHSLMVVRHGQVVAEGWWTPYAANEPHMLFSLSKSFTSTAIGLLQQEGRLNIHDKLVSFFPEDVPADASENLRNMRLRDLLMMATGQEKADVDAIAAAAPDGTTPRIFLAAPVKQKPGTLFYYNSPGSVMLAAVAQKVTGQTVRDYLVPRLFEPLGIPAPDWDQTPQGVTVGASGLHIRTEDIAKFGQLLLQRGEWQGRRLIPAEWVDLATSRQVSNGSAPDGDWDQGYGFQFWRCVPGFYRADGAFGQFCFVMPQYDTVVAITAGTKDTAGVMKLFWARFLPELRAAALPENPAAQAALRERLAGLALPVVAGASSSPLAATVAHRGFVFAANDAKLESIQLATAADGTVTLHAHRFGHDYQLAVGQGRWLRGEFPLSAGNTEPVAASGAWTADDTYTIKVAEYRQPFVATITLKFAGDQVTFEQSWNVSFRNRPAVAPLTGNSLRQ
jgi:CubicO group peptidase (beta-lactamase class C family)